MTWQIAVIGYLYASGVLVTASYSNADAPKVAWHKHVLVGLLFPVIPFLALGIWARDALAKVRK